MSEKNNSTIENKMLSRRSLISCRITSTAIIAALLFMITLSILVERWEYYSKHFRQYLLVELIAVIIIAIMIACSGQKTKTAKIDWFAILFWGGFTLYTLASDVLVDKKFRFAQTLIFVVLVLLGCVWNRNKDKGRFIRDFEMSIQLFLLILLIISIAFPVQSRAEGRYSGPIENPSVYALYLCSIWSVLLGSLEDKINKQEHGVMRILTIVELLAAFTLLLMSQSLTPMIALVAVTFLWFFRLVRSRKGTRFAVKMFFLIGIAGIAAMTIMIVLIRNEIIVGDSRIIQKLQSADLSAFLSERDVYWRRYLREMNLFGHRKKPYLYDHRILPHNALIGMMYWYGVPCVVPYIITMAMGIEKSYRFADTSVPYAPVPFYSIVSFVIMSMADNVEQPFVWLPWIACYLMMAPILIMPVEEIEALKSANADINTEEPEQV